jgi:SRSO17 transposase
MRRTAKRKQRTLSRQALAAADYVFIWTTAPPGTLSADEALALYRVRWQIELAFKRMKSIMGLGHLPKWAETSARAWIHGKLLIALLVERLLDEAETVSPWGYRLGATPQPLA